jgi:hypothetical protein
VKPQRLLIALAILAGLGGAVWYSQKNPPQPESATKTEKVVSVAQDQLQKIRIGRPEETVTVEKAEDGKWRMLEPKQYAVDSSAIETLVRNFSEMNSERVLEENNTDWKTFGLDPGKFWVEGTLKDGKRIRVILGDDAPVGSTVYARVEGSDRLWAIPSYVKVGMDQKAADLRDKRLLPFDLDQASRVTVKNQHGALEFGKAGTNWQIVKPGPVRADTFAVDSMIRSVRDHVYESVIDETGKPPAQYNFSPVFAVFDAVDPSGVHTLTIGKARDNTYYAKTTTMPGVFRISASVAEGLDKRLDDLRNKKLFDFGWSDPQKVEIRDGETRLTIEKKDDKWIQADAGGKELPSDKVQTLIDQLRNLSAAGFPANDSSAQAKYGLSQPIADVRVTSDDGKRVERVLIAAGPQSKHYASRENEPATYELEPSAYDELHKAVEGLK